MLAAPNLAKPLGCEAVALKPTLPPPSLTTSLLHHSPDLQSTTLYICLPTHRYSPILTSSFTVRPRIHRSDLAKHSYTSCAIVCIPHPATDFRPASLETPRNIFCLNVHDTDNPSHITHPAPPPWPAQETMTSW